MSVSSEGERRRRSRKRRDSTARIAVVSLGFLLIFSGVCLLSSAEKISYGGSRWSPARKERFYGSSPYHARASSPSQLVSMEKKNNNENSSSSDKLYEEENRLVHTGPNPLHN
ncbi:hypothetical protein Pfo_023642 [Paulownia fortunei]|nr:hypothetical protein Pfo_023642 [Paulownia fortunei]